jgi:hypothetical protein
MKTLVATANKEYCMQYIATRDTILKGDSEIAKLHATSVKKYSTEATLLVEEFKAVHDDDSDTNFFNLGYMISEYMLADMYEKLSHSLVIEL